MVKKMVTFTNIGLSKGPSLLSAHAFSSSILAAIVVAFSCLSLSGCSTHADSSRRAYTPAEEVALASDLPGPHRAAPESEALDYDPWESFNERTFSFNFNVLDRYGLKPAAKVWSRAVPLAVRHGLANMFDNLAMPRRFVNKILQGRLPGAGEELARFVLNSTVGVAGFFDVAVRLGLHESDADTGQTLGVYGIKPGPYLVLPVLPPLTARDAVGYAADSFMDPLSYFVSPILADIGRSAGYTINERANHMTEYDDVEDTSLDLYAAVRNGFLQRRQKSISDAIRDRDRSWGIRTNRFDEQTESTFNDNQQIQDSAVVKSSE
jgi:phospholipid-binding lipoprotein MlaA